MGLGVVGECEGFFGFGCVGGSVVVCGVLVLVLSRVGGVLEWGEFLVFLWEGW